MLNHTGGRYRKSGEETAQDHMKYSGSFFLLIAIFVLDELLFILDLVTIPGIEKYMCMVKTTTAQVSNIHLTHLMTVK